jgi:adenylate kinase family enzyme
MRIMIFGRSGSGKSTFSLKLSEKLNIPLYHLDKYFYIRNWEERDYQEFLSLHKELINQENWIIDGNIIKTYELRYKHADIAVHFCYPRYKAYWRIPKRRFWASKDLRIDDRAEGCPETIQWRLVKYIWNYENRVKEQVAELQKRYPHITLYTIRSNKELEQAMQKIVSIALESKSTQGLSSKV